MKSNYIGNRSDYNRLAMQVARIDRGQEFVCYESECLNGWDVQSKHIQPENGIAECLWAGDKRYGGGESYVMQKGDET